MNAFIKACIDANKEVFEYLHTQLTSFDLHSTHTIGHGGDVSLHIDLICEEIFYDHLHTFGQIYSEESGEMNDASKIQIIIDPLDGSSNFKASLPYYGSSIAMRENGNVTNSVISNLSTGHIIYKQGNNEVKKLDLRNNKELDFHELSSSGLGIFERAYAYPKICNTLYSKKLKFRSLGAVAVSLANARHYDFVLFAGQIRPFDILAGLHINEDLFIHQSDEFLIVTKNKQKLDQLKDTIKE